VKFIHKRRTKESFIRSEELLDLSMYFAGCASPGLRRRQVAVEEMHVAKTSAVTRGFAVCCSAHRIETQSKNNQNLNVIAREPPKFATE
jgi:hypothetical protein